jgi:hypothetical protein
MWKILQGGIVVALVYSNGVYGWTDNGYVPVALGVAIVGAATYAGNWFWHFRRGLPMPRHHI